LLCLGGVVLGAGTRRATTAIDGIDVSPDAVQRLAAVTALAVGWRLRYFSPVSVNTWPGVKTGEAKKGRHRPGAVCMFCTAWKCLKQRPRMPLISLSSTNGIASQPARQQRSDELVDGAAGARRPASRHAAETSLRVSGSRKVVIIIGRRADSPPGNRLVVEVEWNSKGGIADWRRVRMWLVRRGTARVKVRGWLGPICGHRDILLVRHEPDVITKRDVSFRRSRQACGSEPWCPQYAVRLSK
jgi:hypothetical protein